MEALRTLRGLRTAGWCRSLITAVPAAAGRTRALHAAGLPPPSLLKLQGPVTVFVFDGEKVAQHMQGDSGSASTPRSAEGLSRASLKWGGPLGAANRSGVSAGVAV